MLHTCSLGGGGLGGGGGACDGAGCGFGSKFVLLCRTCIMFHAQRFLESPRGSLKLFIYWYMGWKRSGIASPFRSLIRVKFNYSYPKDIVKDVTGIFLIKKPYRHFIQISILPLVKFVSLFQLLQGRHFNFFLGAKFFFYSPMPPDYWKIGKKQHFICSNLTLFIVPFFSLSFFLLFFFFFFFFFSFFFSFFFFLGGRGGRRPPAPLKWRPWIIV